MSKLNIINAPGLNDSMFGDNIKAQFENINDNFQKLSNYDFTKGEKGDSINIVDIKLSDDDEIKSKILSLLLIYRKEYVTEETEDVTEETEDVEGEFLSKIKYNIESYLNDATIRMIELKDKYVGSLPFVYIDERFHHKNVADDIRKNPGLYDNEVDLSCVILYENNDFKIVKNFPNLYFDENVGYLCWEWLGKKTAVAAAGPQGKTGKSSILLVAKVDKIVEGELTICSEIMVQGTLQPANNEADIKEIHKSLDLLEGESIESWPVIVINKNDPTSIYISSFIKDGDVYGVYCNYNNRIDLGFNTYALWKGLIEHPLDEKGIVLPAYDNGQLNAIPSEGNPSKMHILYTHPGKNALVLEENNIKVDKSNGIINYEISYRDDKIEENQLNIIYNTSFRNGLGRGSKPVYIEDGQILLGEKTGKNRTKITHNAVEAASIKSNGQITLNGEGRSKFNVTTSLANTLSSKVSNTINSKVNQIIAENDDKSENRIIAENKIIAEKNTIIGATEINGEVKINENIEVAKGKKITATNADINNINTDTLNVSTKLITPLISNEATDVNLDENGLRITHDSSKLININEDNNDDDGSYSIFASTDKLRIGGYSAPTNEFFKNLNDIEIIIAQPDKECKFGIYAPALFNNKLGGNTLTDLFCVDNQCQSSEFEPYLYEGADEVQWDLSYSKSTTYFTRFNPNKNKNELHITIAKDCLKNISDLQELSISIIPIQTYYGEVYELSGPGNSWFFRYEDNVSVDVDIVFNINGRKMKCNISNNKKLPQVNNVNISGYNISFNIFTKFNREHPDDKVAFMSKDLSSIYSKEARVWSDGDTTDNLDGAKNYTKASLNKSEQKEIVTINKTTVFENISGVAEGNHEVEIIGRLDLGGKFEDGQLVSAKLGGAIKGTNGNPVEIIGGIKTDKIITTGVAGQILLTNGGMTSNTPIYIDKGNDNKEFFKFNTETNSFYTTFDSLLGYAYKDYNKCTANINVKWGDNRAIYEGRSDWGYINMGYTTCGKIVDGYIQIPNAAFRYMRKNWVDGSNVYADLTDYDKKLCWVEADSFKYNGANIVFPTPRVEKRFSINLLTTKNDLAQDDAQTGFEIIINPQGIISVRGVYNPSFSVDYKINNIDYALIGSFTYICK